MGKKITRGRFLKAMGAASVAGSTLSILACQPSTTAQSGGGGGGPEEKKLNLYNWTDYIGENTVANIVDPNYTVLAKIKKRYLGTAR